MRILIVLLALLVSTPAYAQFSAARAQNAPTESVKTAVTTDAGETREVYVEQKVQADRHGNAAGSQYDLAVDGAFEGQTVAVLHLYTGETFDFALPRAALAEKGFSVSRWINTPRSPSELETKLENACQLWVISGASRQLSDAHVAVIKRFFDSGKGVYLWGDNPPYFGDANAVANALFGAHMSGNTQGEQRVELPAQHGVEIFGVRLHLSSLWSRPRWHTKCPVESRARESCQSGSRAPAAMHQERTTTACCATVVEL